MLIKRADYLKGYSVSLKSFEQVQYSVIKSIEYYKCFEQIASKLEIQ